MRFAGAPRALADFAPRGTGSSVDSPAMLSRALHRMRRWLARTLRESGDRRRDLPDLEGALLRYRLALLAAEPRGGTLRRCASAATLCGRERLAERCWEEASRRVPDDPEAWARRARIAARAGRLEEARDHARRYLELDTVRGSRFTRGSSVASLLAHLERGPATEPKARHIALCGVSYCGSTLVSYFLGSLPGVANVGESHWLVHRADRSGPGFGPAPLEFRSGAPSGMPLCGHCRRPDCPVLGIELRSGLARDPVDWFDRIAAAQGEPVLISSDKNHVALQALDPWLRFDAVVLFRSPLHAWSSTRTKRTNKDGLADYLRAWDREYRSLLYDFPNRGRRLFVDFESLRRDLPRHLAVLCSALDLPFDVRFVTDVERRQHAIGGNTRVHRALQEERPFEVVARDPVELPAEERVIVARFEAKSPVLAALRAGHARVFGGG